MIAQPCTLTKFTITFVIGPLISLTNIDRSVSQVGEAPADSSLACPQANSSHTPTCFTDTINLGQIQ